MYLSEGRNAAAAGEAEPVDGEAGGRGEGMVGPGLLQDGQAGAVGQGHQDTGADVALKKREK